MFLNRATAYELTPDAEADLAEAERGEFATDAEIAAMWAKYDR